MEFRKMLMITLYAKQKRDKDVYFCIYFYILP